MFCYEAHNKFLSEENKSLRDQLTACATVADNNSSSPNGKVSRPRKQAKRYDDMVDAEGLAGMDQFPSLPKPRDPRQRAAGTSTYNSNGNRFDILAETTTAINQTAVPVQQAAGARASSRPTRSSVPAAATSASNPRKKIMQAIDVDLFKVRQHLMNAKVSDFSVKQTSMKGPVKITINNESQVAAAKAALVSNRVSYHEFKWADEKRKCFIIRGLVGTKEEHLHDIKTDLINAGLPDSIVLSLHYTGFMRANPGAEMNPPVKMVVPPKFDETILSGIKHLNHIAVRFELFKSHSVVQCKNCQRFGHSAGGCMHQHRCVKCGLNHLREDCPRTHSTQHKLRCCNCGGEHTANNLNSCEYFQRQFAQKPKSSVPAKSVSSAQLSSLSVQPGVSFAQMAAGSSSRQQNHNRRPTQNTSGNYNVDATATNATDEVQISLNKLIDYIDSRFDQLSQSIAKHDRILELLSSKLLDE